MYTRKTSFNNTLSDQVYFVIIHVHLGDYIFHVGRDISRESREVRIAVRSILLLFLCVMFSKQKNLNC